MTQRSANRPDPRILILGDSFVEGVGATDHQGWAQAIAKRTPCHIIGRGGYTSTQILSCLPDMPFTKTIVQIGTNDALYRCDAKATQGTHISLARNIRTLAAHAATAADILFVGLLFCDEARSVLYRPNRAYYNADLAAFSDVIATTCAEIGAPFVSLDNIPRKPDLLADGIHPSDIGHREIFQHVWSEVRKRI